MRGHCILSHGFESGPDATKVTALSAVAERFGWTHERPDYTDLDARREVSKVGDVPAVLTATVSGRITNIRSATVMTPRQPSAVTS